MKKYLFTDGGTSGVKEAQSHGELENFIDSSANPHSIRIWLFSSSEWISYASYRKLHPVTGKKELTTVEDSIAIGHIESFNKKRGFKKYLLALAIIAGTLLIFNFTRIRWVKASPVSLIASRPANVPVMDIDSLISEIENDRGNYLDRNTKTNLRLRNTWPNRIELKLNAERESNGPLSRYFNIDISIDNTTGFNLDKAVVRLNTWSGRKLRNTDTIQFSGIRYDKLSVRRLRSSYRGDSISVSFEYIRAKAFNFCYSSEIKNNPGNYNDRWFCRGE